jgi:hypothetical protein
LPDIWQYLANLPDFWQACQIVLPARRWASAMQKNVRSFAVNTYLVYCYCTEATRRKQQQQQKKYHTRRKENKKNEHIVAIDGLAIATTKPKQHRQQQHVTEL